MRSLIYILVGAITAVLVRAAIMPVVGLFADLMLILPPLWLWLHKNHTVGVSWLVIASVISDAVSSTPYPYLTLSGLCAGAIFLLVFEPMLSSDNSLTNLVSIVLWVGVWRASYAGLLSLSMILGATQLGPHLPTIAEVVGWFAGSAVLWLAMMLFQSVWKKLNRHRHATS
jgi:hypothetical protein